MEFNVILKIRKRARLVRFTKLFRDLAMITIKKFLSGFILLLSFSSYADSNRFLALSDLHFNPFDTSQNYPVTSASDNDHNDTNL